MVASLLPDTWANEFLRFVRLRFGRLQTLRQLQRSYPGVLLIARHPSQRPRRECIAVSGFRSNHGRLQHSFNWAARSRVHYVTVRSAIQPEELFLTTGSRKRLVLQHDC